MARYDPALPIQEKVSNLLPNGRLVPMEGANDYTIVFSPERMKQVVATIDEFLRSGV